MKTFTGNACFSFKGKLNYVDIMGNVRQMSSPEVPTPTAINNMLAAKSNFKGLTALVKSLNTAARSALKSLASAAGKTAGTFSCCVKPRVMHELDLNGPEFDFYFNSSASLQPVGLFEPDTPAYAILKLRRSAAAGGKQVPGAEEALALKTEGLAKYEQQQEQLKANLEAADAAAKAGTAFFGDLESSCVMLEQCIQADTEAVGDDVDGERIDDSTWENLLADPKLAAMVAEMQAGRNAC